MKNLATVIINSLVLFTTGVFIFAGTLHLIGLSCQPLFAPTVALFGVLIILVYLFGTKGLL